MRLLYVLLILRFPRLVLAAICLVTAFLAYQATKEAKLVITADGCWRRGKVLDLKTVVNEAVADCPSVEKVLVWRRGGGVTTAAGELDRDVEWSAAVDSQSDECPPESMDSEDPLFILYTSGRLRAARTWGRCARAGSPALRPSPC